MKFNEQKLERQSEPQFSDLDVKGREIFGLEPKSEKFSSLEVGKDVEIVKKNNNIKSEINLDSLFLFVNPKDGTDIRMVQAPHWQTISSEYIHASFKTEHGALKHGNDISDW